MKRRFLSKISFLLVFSMLFTVSLPVLAYAASYIKVTYNWTNGEIQGIIYSGTFNNAITHTLSTHMNNDWTNLPANLVGSQRRYTPYQRSDSGDYHLINGTLEPGLSFDKIKIIEQSWRTTETIVEASVTGSVYEFENITPDIIEDHHTFQIYPISYENGTTTMRVTWPPVQQVGLIGYKVYKNDIFVADTVNNYYDFGGLEYGSKHQFSVSAMPSGGGESPRSSYLPMKTGALISADKVGINGKESGYKLQPSDTILTFTAYQKDTVTQGQHYTELHLGLVGPFVSDFHGTPRGASYKFDDTELSNSDFELKDQDNNIVPIAGFTRDGGQLHFAINQLLEDGKEYSLGMSSSSSGNEISMPLANTAYGFLYFYTSNDLDVYSNMNYTIGKIVIGDSIIPNKPQGFTATAGDSRIDISWRANTESDLQGYLVYLDGALLTPTPITQTNYSIRNLTNGTTYHVNVAAVDKAGNRSLQAFAYPKPAASGGNGVPGPGPGDLGGGSLPPTANSGAIPLLEPQVKVIKADDLKPVAGKLPITITNEDKKIQLPAGAAAISNNSVLALNSEELSVEIPGSLLMQLQQMVPVDQLKDAQISVSFEKLTNEQVNSALESTTGKLSNTTVKVAGEVYEFALSITTKDGKVQKLSAFDQPITLKLKLAAGANPNLLGVYYLGDNGELEYVGGQIEDGFIVVSVSHFSKYAVLEYSKQFDDVPASHWASKAIERLVSKHAITGVSDTSFAPTQHVTRAEFASLLVRSLGLKAKGRHTFSDVDAKIWYAEDITAAAEAGIVNGRSATTFAPEDTLTRQEMTVMLMKAYGIITGKPIDDSQASTFKDVDKIATWAIQSVNAASKLGYVQGKGNNSFVPLGTATRAEAVQIVYKLQ